MTIWPGSPHTVPFPWRAGSFPRPPPPLNTRCPQDNGTGRVVSRGAGVVHIDTAASCIDRNRSEPALPPPRLIRTGDKTPRNDHSTYQPRSVGIRPRPDHCHSTYPASASVFHLSPTPILFVTRSTGIVKGKGEYRDIRLGRLCTQH